MYVYVYDVYTYSHLSMQMYMYIYSTYIHKSVALEILVKPDFVHIIGSKLWCHHLLLNSY